MGTLDEYGFTEFSSNDTVKKAFLENVEDGLGSKKIDIIPGADGLILPFPFPPVVPAPGFYTGETLSEHENSFPKYHEIIFPMMEEVSKALNLEPATPKFPPIQDPTKPIKDIIELIKDLVPGLEIDLGYVIPLSKDFIDAALEFPDDYEPLYDLIIAMPGMERYDARDIEKLISGLEISFEVPEVDFSIPPPLPLPPFIEIPIPSIPLLSIPNVGIVDLIKQLINAAITAIEDFIAAIAELIDQFIRALMEGLKGLIRFLFELFIVPIMAVIEKFKAVLAQLGWVSTIGVIIKYLIGMMIVSIVTFILGPGMISQGIAELLNLV